MAQATRTVNPLHFEDLEPHRFEDLVRQLIYTFRTWRALEPTGRLGSDEGIDIRGIEVVRVEEDTDLPDDEAEEAPPTLEAERVWIIQCKREKQMGPERVKKTVAEALDGNPTPHGFVLVAASDFSKRARDEFRAEVATRGVQEWHLWGKADLEDMLFRPENDHLLFAYFGISQVFDPVSRKIRVDPDKRITFFDATQLDDVDGDGDADDELDTDRPQR